MEEIKAERKEIIATTFEKHFQTALLSILTALIIAGVFSITSMKEQLVRMDERDKTKQSSIESLQKTMDMIRSDMSIMNNRITIIEEKSKK